MTFDAYVRICRLLSACGLFPDLRDCFYRERSDGLYGAGAFMLSYAAHALPTDIFSVLIFAVFGFDIETFLHHHLISSASFFVVGLSLSLQSFWVYCFSTFAAVHIGESMGMTACVIFDNLVCGFQRTILVHSRAMSHRILRKTWQL